MYKQHIFQTILLSTLSIALAGCAQGRLVQNHAPANDSVQQANSAKVVQVLAHAPASQLESLQRGNSALLDSESTERVAVAYMDAAKFSLKHGEELVEKKAFRQAKEYLDNANKLFEQALKVYQQQKDKHLVEITSIMASIEQCRKLQAKMAETKK